MEQWKALGETLASKGVVVRFQEPMQRHTTFRIGGPAALYLIPKDQAAVRASLAEVRTAGCPYFVLGNGSNVVFPDEGYRGAVISTEALDGIAVEGTRLVCGGGATMTQAAKTAREYGLAGLEFFTGIPGSCGGAVRMNAGAYGGETADVLESSVYVTASDTVRLPGPAHGFGYRKSVYRDYPERVVTEVVFSLRRGEKEEISAVMRELMRRRAEKQPLEYPSAGSVFKRCEGRFTGRMIEEAGLKGARVGGAMVSEKHAGFIVNTGGATAADVSALVEQIRTTVAARFGCTLECEIIFVR